MRLIKRIRLALDWYLNCWIQFFLHATDVSACRTLSPEEILRKEGLVWDPELKKFRRIKNEPALKEM